ncbi:MAG: adenylate/guanylate cyclase domain-containing protein [Mariprofundus sp.]|nr:adenylate/guanylate cyclase domain-containing protein [Mariprofundus sp.]
MFNKPLSIAQKVLLAIFLAIIFVMISQLKGLENLVAPLEDRANDYQFLVRGQISSDNDLIRIILIDEDSAMDQYGYQSPTPRPLLTNLVNHLIAKKVAVIGIDILLDYPSHWPTEDADLARAFENANGKVVLAALAEHENEEQNIIHSDINQPLPMFVEHVNLGDTQVLEDAGGVARQIRIGNQASPSLAEQMYIQYLGKAPSLPHLNLKKILKEFWVDINYLGPPSRLENEGGTVFPVFAAEEVEFLPESLFKDKIIFIGSGIDLLGDIFLTPFSTSANNYLPAYGVELHALVLDMLLNKNNLTVLSPSVQNITLFCFFFTIGIIVLITRTAISMPLILGLTASWVFIIIWIFLNYQIKFPIIAPLFGLTGLISTCFLIVHQTQQRQASFLKNTFKRYIPPELVNQLIKNPEQMDMGGEAKELTVFFSDIEGFTTISEQFTPYELVSFLNTYLGKMTDILFEEKGTLDKYEGDAIIAFFGAPVDVQNHADHACQTALRMQRTITVLNEEWKGTNKPFLNVRIGLNTGTVIVGNIGSDTRSDYTVIGDTANLASRLEGVNKLFGTNIMISQQTLNATRLPYFKRELARLIVKGKTEAITVYQLIECLPAEKGQLQLLNKKYETVLQSFYNGDFNSAAKGFANLANEYEDKASEFMKTQAIEHANNQPDIENWTGAIALTSK